MTKRKAVIIDDAYSRPSQDDLLNCVPKLRQFLASSREAKQWFDINFGLTGSVRSPAYFEPLIQDAQKIQLLWQKKEECPEADRLLENGLADLVVDVCTARNPLIHIEKALLERNCDISTFSALPDIAAVPCDTDIVAIDYVLTPDMPEDLDEKIKKSTEFLKNLIVRANSDITLKLPLIVLVSSRPTIERQETERFRNTIGIQGAYFHFIRKPHLESQFGLRIDGFSQEIMELESYRKVHISLIKSLQHASSSLINEVINLELQDFAALHVGHLINEKEALSDYVGWMLGQALMTKLQISAEFAIAANSLPQEHYKVLLGHLQPTQGIPKLFAEISSVRTAAGDMHKAVKGERLLRFGDIFAALTSEGTINFAKFYLLISQTCDLLQCKITNGHVLCVEGAAVEVKATEAELMRATLRQLDAKGSTLIQKGESYFQVIWKEADLCTIPQAKLKLERGYEYIGRLNEVYALEAQHNALNNLGRIGVPIKPGYGMVYSSLRLKVWSSKAEVAALSRHYCDNTVVAVVRPRPKSQVIILLSGGAKKWLIQQLKEFIETSTFINDLIKPANEIIECLSENADFHFICKKNKSEALTLNREKIEIDQTTKEEKITTVLINKVAVVFEGASILDSTTTTDGVRLQLEFESLT